MTKAVRRSEVWAVKSTRCPQGDHFPLRVRIQKTADLKHDTDLLIDQIRAISNARFMFRYCTLPSNTLKKVEEALRLLTAR